MMNAKTGRLFLNSRWAHALITAVCAILYAHSAQAALPHPRFHAIWVYPNPAQPANNPVLNAAAGQQLIANARASNVNLLYLSVYNSTPNSNNRYMYDETAIANLVAAAHFAGMQVYAAYGDPAWPTLGCGTPGNPSFPIARIQEIGAYNQNTPPVLVYDPVSNASYPVASTFDGIILDVEPPAADQNLLDLYTCSQTAAQQYYLSLSVAINAFWNNAIGSSGPAYQQILGMGLTHVVIMGYRSFAGTFGANDNGILALDTPALQFLNNPYSVLIGLETQNLGASDPQNTQSFYASGQAALDYQAQSVYNQLGANGISFAGFAIDNYNDSYLSGATNWPFTNPTFPTQISVEYLSTGAAPQEVYATIGATNVGVIFPNNTNPNATVTVTPLNPATQTPTPSGFQLTNFAFDISTTAVFTGPVTVCLTVPSMDAATFAALSVLHYAGGVAVDQTIRSGPYAPDPVSQTICASVTSFSPFVLGKATVAPKSGTACNGVFNGVFKGNITVSAGQTCKFVAGSISGNVSLNGGNLVLSGAGVGGNVEIQEGGKFTIGPGSTIGGNLEIQDLPGGSVQNQVCGTTVRGNLEFQNNGTAVEIGSASSALCAGNKIGGNLTIQNNMAPTVAYGNSVAGNLQDQNNMQPTQVFRNAVGGNLLCHNDSSITGGGNTAKSKLGQCAAF